MSVQLDTTCRERLVWVFFTCLSMDAMGYELMHVKQRLCPAGSAYRGAQLPEQAAQVPLCCCNGQLQSDAVQPMARSMACCEHHESRLRTKPC